jgi:predicted membrane protein
MKPKNGDASGPWPFVTRRIHCKTDGSTAVWSSRHHRKGLVSPEAAKAVAITETLLRCLWMPRKLNWWIGIIFAIGSLLFAVASVLSLAPALAHAWSLDATGINAIFFAGSIPFTIAAYLQLFQAANAGEFPRDESRAPRRRVLFGWRPEHAGWLSCALQFAGTILFNFNTFDAMIPSLNWFQQDLLIWAPNIVGSVLFLASGYLAFIETSHAHWAWKPTSISWWVVFTNLLGCVGFMVSAVLAIVLPGTPNTEAITVSVLFTLLGAIGFLVGSLLMLPEAISQPES